MSHGDVDDVLAVPRRSFRLFAVPIIHSAKARFRVPTFAPLFTPCACLPRARVSSVPPLSAPGMPPYDLPVAAREICIPLPTFAVVTKKRCVAYAYFRKSLPAHTQLIRRPRSRPAVNERRPKSHFGIHRFRPGFKKHGIRVPSRK